MGARVSHLLVGGTPVKVLEGADDVLAEARGEHVLLHAELVARLPDDGVDDVQPGHLVLRLALWRRRETLTCAAVAYGDEYKVCVHYTLP